ncbi:hypothetical protein C8R42DRAFT_399795 [Lentinula raphanica]|nr:hypothetical protein C8R42DRAFT_399795 [Lentinula raphanica]
MDFATISYSVPASRLNEDVVFHVLRPMDTSLVDEVAFLDVATCKLSLIVVPPWTQYCTSEGAGLKIFAGQGSYGPTRTRHRGAKTGHQPIRCTFNDTRRTYLYSS